jgi:acyl-CoA thioester hydrolase
VNPATITVCDHVQWADTDASGHHHNGAIVRFAEAAEAELMRAHDVPDYFSSSPRVCHEVNYHAPLYFGQEVVTTVRLERIGYSSMAFTFEVWGEPFHGNAKVRAASGRFVTAHVPPGATSAIPWPEEWAARLGHSPAIAAESE